MKSMSDIMLQAHFKELKQELEKAKNEELVTEHDKAYLLLKKTFNFLKEKSETAVLGSEGVDLLYELAQYLDDKSIKQ